MQKVSQEVWEKKYQLKDKDGNPVDKTMDDTFLRVAKALADVEVFDKVYWQNKFYDAIKAGAYPAGRIMANAGAGDHKPGTSLINCSVIPVEDSIEGIMQGVTDSAIAMATGSGVGYCFSTLRPRGAFVQGAGARTSGPLSFMDIYDAMCKTISSAGGRRGSQMATFHVSHPDIFEFINAKREDGRLRQFNMSVLVTDEFMNAVEADKEWQLTFNGTLYKTVQAREIWDAIMQSTYDYAEPGVIFIDAVNDENNLNFCEDITATNPCGEVPLPDYGSCLLGSIDLSRFVEGTTFNYDFFTEIVGVFTRMLDNVVEVNGLPLEQQRRELETKRRHGMGITGLGTALNLMGIRYGSPEAVEFVSTVMRMMAFEGYKTGIYLAKEKGSAPVLEDIADRHEFVASHYMQQFDDEIRKGIVEHGCRFSHHTSIAPTGTMSLALCDNVSNGIEPTFAHEYKRNIIIEGKATKQQETVYSKERLIVGDSDGMVTADDVTPSEHIAMQAAAQEWVDQSISKTINVPTDISYEDFKDIYMQAWSKGLKGCTTFRYNPEAFTGVLVRDSDLENTTYEFTTEDGQKIKLKGSDTVQYEGDTHNAANLADAIKENLYGKF